jgi:hypothetical protein
MSYFDSSMADFDSAQILNLQRIIELCDVPDVGPSPLDPDLTPEVRHTNALTTLEKTSGVFDDAYYQDAVFSEEIPEVLLDQYLLDKALAKGVPEAHLPEKCMRNPPKCPPPPQTMRHTHIRAQISPLNSTSGKLARTLGEDIRKANLERIATPYVPTRPSLTRPSISLPSLRSFLTMSPSANNSRQPTPTHSVASIFSTTSQTSTRYSSSRKSKRRDTLRNLFRRDHGFSERPAPLDETMAWSPPSLSECEAPSLDSSVGTHDQSSLQSSLSSRTSTSSFIDCPSLSWLDNRTLQKYIKTPQFTSLQVRCQNEAKRFIDFAQHQRVALPLFLGRTRVYLEGRMVTRIAELKKTVSLLRCLPKYID